jgi:hypothetical protein
VFQDISQFAEAQTSLVPIKEVEFKFPSEYEDTGELGDRLWNEMMPSMYISVQIIGGGFLIVWFSWIGFLEGPIPEKVRYAA